MTRRSSFLWGAIGALAPPFLNLYRVLEAGGPVPHREWVAYSIALLVYVLLGGGFTVAWRPESEFKAVWIGASWPAITAAILQSVPGLPK